MKFFETIKILNGEIFYLNYHNMRFNQTQKAFFKIDKNINLKEFITPPKDGLYRCKVTYSKEIENIEYFIYKEREFKKFQIINIDFEYSYKFLDRSKIEDMKTDFDEIIMVKNSFLTDTSIANIAIFKDRWLTPKTPLLKGVTRERLLKCGFLKEENLKVKDLLNAEKFAIMNAMIDFKEIKFKEIDELGFKSTF